MSGRKIIRGLQEAVAHAEGNTSLARLRGNFGCVSTAAQKEGAMSALNQAASLLFTERQRVANVNFYLGTRRGVTADEIAAEFLRVETLIDSGGFSQVEDIDGNLDD